MFHSEIRFAIKDSFLGSTLVAKNKKGVCAVFLGDHPAPLIEALETTFPRSIIVDDLLSMSPLLVQVIKVIENPYLKRDFSIDVQGSCFQQRVWQALETIPVGTTLSYSDIAKQIGAPLAYRAVAKACAANNLAVVIACHRVIGRNGNLSGYRWGIERKRLLIKREAA